MHRDQTERICPATNLEPREAWVVVEHLHLVLWEGPQHLLYGVQLVDLTLPREECLAIAQLTKDTTNGPDIHHLPIRSSVGRG